VKDKTGPSSSLFIDFEYSRFAASLAVFSAALQFAVHAWWQFQSGNPFQIVPRLVSLLHDCVIIIFIYLAGSMIAGMAPSRLRNGILLPLHAFVCFAASCLMLLYPRHIPDFLNFPVNIFGVDSGASMQFAAQFISVSDIISVNTLTAVLFVFSFYKGVPAFLSHPHYLIKAVFLIAAAVTLAAPSPNPFVFSVQESVVSGVFGGRRQFPLLVRPNSMPAGMKPADNLVSPFDDFPMDSKIAHVVVIVMETVEGSRFTREILENNKTFIGSRRSEFRYFSKYFTTNLDSYTSLVAMIASVFVPFPAYSDPEMYSGVRNAPNLAAAFRRSGAACMYISTAMNQPFIPSSGDWNSTLTRKDIPDDPSMAHIDSPPIESAVEDRAARPAIMDFMRKNPRSFIVHECVFGHTQQWLDLTRKSQLEYYDQYVRELTENITALGLSGKTLFILAADHGSRQDPAEIENYRVPLIMWGPGVKAGDDGRFLSHLDFGGLIYEAFSGKPWPASDKPLLTVGHSGKWVYGEIRPDGAYQFLDNSRGHIIGHGGSLEPLKLAENFQRYLEFFKNRFPDPRNGK
jgi:hypothetical protein